MNRGRFLGIVATTALLPRFAWAKPSKALIVVFSRRGNTLALARMIAERTGADIFVLQPAAPYPKDYRANVEQVARENAQGFLPPLARLPENLEAYRTVFLGFPTWAMQLPPPVKSFLKQADLADKTVLPFNTHGGYGAGETFAQTARLAPKSTVKTGFSVKGSQSAKVRAWWCRVHMRGRCGRSSMHGWRRDFDEQPTHFSGSLSGSLPSIRNYP